MRRRQILSGRFFSNFGAFSKNPNFMIEVSWSRNKIDIAITSLKKKMNKQICFSILTTWKYMKLEIKIQVSNKFVFFLRSYGSIILFRDQLTFSFGDQYSLMIIFYVVFCPCRESRASCNPEWSLIFRIFWWYCWMIVLAITIFWRHVWQWPKISSSQLIFLNSNCQFGNLI